MLNFVKRCFRAYINVLLWINLVLTIVIMGALGYAATMMPGSPVADDSMMWKIVCPVVGVILGAVIGISTNIFWGGLIATFIEIGNDLTEVKKLAADTRMSSAETAAVFQKMANRQAGGV
jgi:hypothetical protein